MDTLKRIKNIEFNRVVFSTRFFIIGFILSITFFFLLANSFKVYQSEVSIMVNAKSIVAAKQQQQIVSNMLEFPKTLSFYKRMLLFNPDMRDVTLGQPDAEKIKNWNKMISVERANYDASVIKISISTSRETDSVLLVNKVARNLFETSAFYYNVKNDVDLRIIDGPITRTHFSNLILALLISLAGGFIISLLLEYLIFGDFQLSIKRPEFLKINTFFDFKKKHEMPIEEELESLNNLYQNEQSDEAFVFDYETEDEKLMDNEILSDPIYDEKFQQVKKITKILEPEKYPNFPEMPVQPKISAGAPDNLPIADDSYFAQYSAPIEANPVLEEKTEEQSVIKTITEPTPEELKKRLNELLRGKL